MAKPRNTPGEFLVRIYLKFPRGVAYLDANIPHLRADTLASIAGVDVTTARRWMRAKRFPAPVARLLDLVVGGRLDAFGWRGWRLLDGKLVSPEGWEFDPGQVLAMPLLRAQVAALETERRRFLALDDQTTTEPAADALERIVRIA